MTIGEGTCVEGEGDQAYVPGEGEIGSREGCFITPQGVVNYRVTLPGAHVYVGIVGRNVDTIDLSDFAWLGNQDTPGSPTLWNDPRG